MGKFNGWQYVAKNTGSHSKNTPSVTGVKSRYTHSRIAWRVTAGAKV